MNTLRVLSLGGGVQSSAMLLMALEGRFGDRPDVAIFADPRWESAATYAWLEELEREVAPFPIVRVSAGDIRADAIAGRGKPGDTSGKRFASLPFFLRNPDGSAGMGRRQCSSEDKIKPIRRWIREWAENAEVWIGISTDEAHRMKPADVKYLTHRWPLIDARLSREACANYLLERMGKVAPKSSCRGCPFHDEAFWAWQKREAPDEHADVVEFDIATRHTGSMNAEQYVHRSLRPLGEIAEFLHETQGRIFLDEFGNECEGVCGL